MTEIEVTGTVAKIIPPRDTYTQGQLGTARLHFTFGDDWQGYTDLKAIFDCGVASADAAIVNDECTVPQDVLATPYRIISISISGNDGANAISTAWVRLGQVLPSGTSGGGGRFVTFDELAQMLLNYVTFGDLDDYVTKAELAAAIADLAKKNELDALTAAFDALVLAVDDKADKSELDKYVLKSIYDGFVQAVNDALALKANLTDLDDVWKKSEITLVTSGDGKSFLGNDGQYHVIQGGSGDAKAFIAEYNVTTAQEIIDFIDTSNEPYAPMQVKRSGSYYTVVTAVKQDTDKAIIRTFGTLSGNYYMFTYTITGNVWASSSYGFQPTLVSGTNIKTINGESLLGSGNIEIQSATQTQADWNETDTTKPAYIKNKPDIPDVSGFATKESVQAVSDTVSTLSGTVINQGVAIQNLTNEKADKATLADYATTEYVDGNFAKTTDIPDVSGFETTAHANATFATKDALTTGLAGKVDTATLDDYETSAHADATFATKDALNTATDACWKKSEIGLETTGTGTLFLANDGTYRPASGDPPDLTPYLKKTEAENIYATIALADRVTAAEADIDTLETDVAALKTGLVKSVTASGFTVTPDTNGNVDVGGTKVTKTSTSPQIGVSDVSISVQQILPATEDSTTGEGETLPITYTETTTGALTEYSNFTIDGVPIATKDDLTAGQSSIKSISAGGVEVTPSATGNVAIEAPYFDGGFSQRGGAGSNIFDHHYNVGKTTVSGVNVDMAVTYTRDDGFHKEATIGGCRVATYDEMNAAVAAAASPIKSIKVDKFNVLTPDANGQVVTGRTPVAIAQSTTEGITNYWVGIYEDLPGGVAGPGEGSALSITYKANDTELTSFAIRSGATVSSGTAYELPTMKWVREYVASLDGTNISA